MKKAIADPVLDIVVTHYNEPWSIVRKFFDMLGCQRGIDFSAIHVILVHDGVKKFPGRYFKEYPYEVTQYCIPHGGVSAARNYGLETATAKWVQFCDCDDMYSNAYALFGIMPHLELDMDYIWTEFMSEYKKGGETRAKNTGENIIFVHGKYFRREWLNRNNLRFPEGIHYSEDSAFCALVNELAEPGRRGKIKTHFPAYIWCVRNDSVSMKPENAEQNMTGFIDRNFYVLEEYKRRGIPRTLMVGRTFADAYWAFHRKDHKFPAHEQYFVAEAEKYLPELHEAMQDDESMKAVMFASKTAFLGQEEENPESFNEWISRLDWPKKG